MSYHVSILRTHNGARMPIARDELIRAVELDAELEWREADQGRLDVLVAGAPTGGPMRWSGGELWMENPDEEDLERMLRLAERLRARVRGDEFETYRTPGETYTRAEDEAELQGATNASQRLARRAKTVQVFLFLGIMAVFALLVFLKRYLFD